ncbi:MULTISPECIES: efflux RND transporter periplasmic adaptor subunit [unclassified Janthinobacterium]|uniref:efflux RND transporter periplasmic adaptor subunit n=1 Tax=unclassified Janthinobacterium TaxID=2610881 RepID=UPI0017AC3908|nr:MULTISPECIES: efflux RND transporter periplasmic adaptor subunit [unclassified Janthinobacterium]MBB5368878.1 cobalt-zinc-cadmium efflux system membrane fusion protein [Janthinobacterium sp. K2C7]MBB5381586.1 cobalt-zinc-cadmium efflux system membrane fusion protein [Janthinobacterium sp. K2Li3]MBB5387260.1 cobalt-zinc-cadmium efflux system membrane fusion protein [Janthinobacterium sp. K2E3]
MFRNKKYVAIGATAGCALLAAIAVSARKMENDVTKSPSSLSEKAAPAKDAQNSVTLTEVQSKQISIVTAQPGSFTPESDAVGYIDFNQDRTVPVFAPYQGRVRQVFAKAGDDVKKGQALFSIDSPDLLQAESNLVSTAGLLALNSRVLERAKKMLEVQVSAQKDVEQAMSDQQTADGNYRAARDAVRIFGKSDTQIDQIVASRKIDGELTVTSPLTGRVTARNASAGLLLQPGTAPAPFTVADLSTMWMVANVSEYDLPQLKVGQQAEVTVMAYPGQTFRGEITNIAVAVDPVTHRAAVRSDIKDAQHQLHPQMLATYAIHTGSAQQSMALPANSVVREGDGSMTVLVTKDGRTFSRRLVKLGLQQHGAVQITDGLAAGEKVAGDGALFISNMLALQAR